MKEKGLKTQRCEYTLVSKGEANVVATGAALTKRLSICPLPAEAIAPAFGMTETCAGSIYSHKFPAHDIANKHEFASLGCPIPQLEMRVTTQTNLPTSTVQAK